ncbi:Shedu immune nuclease family protein [Neorhizobium galegae]|uniref:Shedu immune nuclease family protein n=1 Tax=Neorhizobium galegae TaxID=399 RepID=UPI0021038681|nr:Shedu immune nuclease family protein [Neorhizobium galegae]MCQ1833354.1 DUF4263 domain-containing protein [Neorhizobium galegae]
MSSDESAKSLVAVVPREDHVHFDLHQHSSGDQDLSVDLTPEMIQELWDERIQPDYGPTGILLANYSAQSGVITTYPRVMQAGSWRLGRPKYSTVKRISFEKAHPIGRPDEKGNFSWNLDQFPPGFTSDMFEGFGVIYMLRFIIEAIEELADIEEICLCNDETTSVVGNTFRLPLNAYDLARKTLQRTHKAAVNFANQEKRAYLRSEFIVPNLPDDEQGPQFRRSYGDLKVILDSAINTPGRKSTTRTSNASAAVRAVRTSAKELITDNPDEVFELNREIELVSLEDVIGKFELRLSSSRSSENSWQKFLSRNPFILRLAFGLPAIIFREQMPVGGWDFDGKGGKLADFVMKSGSLGNLAIVEIKTPKSDILRATPYRGGVHAPSTGLSGAVTQVLDQKYLLQRNITAFMINSGITDVAAYAVGCIVIAGTSPQSDAEKKSFELYRNNLSGVVVITFDELLEKLKALHEFLSENPRPGLEDEDDDEDDGSLDSADELDEDD